MYIASIFGRGFSKIRRGRRSSGTFARLPRQAIRTELRAIATRFVCGQYAGYAGIVANKRNPFPYVNTRENALRITADRITSTLIDTVFLTQCDCRGALRAADEDQNERRQTDRVHCRRVFRTRTHDDGEVMRRDTLVVLPAETWNNKRFVSNIIPRVRGQRFVSAARRVLARRDEIIFSSPRGRRAPTTDVCRRRLGNNNQHEKIVYRPRIIFRERSEKFEFVRFALAR